MGQINREASGQRALLLRNAGVSTYVLQLLTHEACPPSPEGSELAQHLAEGLKEFGQVHHSSGSEVISDSYAMDFSRESTAIDWLSPEPEVGLASHDETLWEPAEPFAPAQQKAAAWRKLIREPSFDATWLAGGGSDGLGVTELSARTSVIAPFPVFGSPLIVSPSFGASFLDRPNGVDLPDKLCCASLGVMWRKQVSNRMRAMVGVTPGFSSDMEATENAVRITGFGAATYQWTPTLEVTLGAVYLDRSDISVLPLAGLVWVPNEDMRLDLTFPRPRISRRLHWYGADAHNAEDWLYFAGQLGGGTYAVDRPSGFEDEMTLRDFRLILGMERKTDFGVKGLVEIGYVFGRKIEFERDTVEYEPTDTVMLGAGISF